MAITAMFLAATIGHTAPPQGHVPDSEGLWRDTRYFLAYQFAAIGVLYTMPENVTGWTDEQKSEYSLSTWWDNVTHPDWDSDDAFINYVTHPYWGAAYYVRARERGWDRSAAFWYSVLLSTSYEVGAEALFEEPSYQDLIVTPVLGSLLGEYFVRVRDNTKARIAARGQPVGRDRWVLVLTDPLGALNRRVRRAMGRDTDIQIYPYYATHQRLRDPSTGVPVWQSDTVVGLYVEISW